MGKVTVTDNLQILYNALRRLETALETAATTSQIKVRNWARDESATDSRDRIFYFDAVDKGRVGFGPRDAVGPSQPGQRRPMLHYKTSPETWVIRKNVGPSSPARIRELASQTIRDGWSPLIANFLAQATANNKLPTTVTFQRLQRRMKRFILKSWKDATLKNTVLRDTKNLFYGDRLGQTAKGPVIPLAEAFKIDGDSSE